MTYLEPVTPIATQRRRYKPQVGHAITVDLPGERIRARIEGVVNEDAVVCVVISTPMAKTQHQVAKDDTICVRRALNNIGLECWEMISEREMEQREQVARFEEAERVKAADAERARMAQGGAAEAVADAPPPAAVTKAAVKRKPRKRVLARKPVRRKKAKSA